MEQHGTDEERDRYGVPEDAEERAPFPEGRMATATAVDTADDERDAVPEDRDAAASADERTRPAALPVNGSDGFELYTASDVEAYRRRWDTVQAGFVDDPTDAAERADALIGELVERVSERRRQLHDELGARDDRDGGDTEAMRQAIRRYRAFFSALVRE